MAGLPDHHHAELLADPRVRSAQSKLATDEGYLQWLQRSSDWVCMQLLEHTRRCNVA
jgi:hypothetical protein